MTWQEEAEKAARAYSRDCYFEYEEVYPRNMAVLHGRWNTVALEDQVGKTTPLPLGTSLKEMNDMMCAGGYFTAIGILYSGPWRESNGIWCVPLEALLHDPKKIFKILCNIRH